MEAVLAVTVGWLYACGLYLLLRRTLAQVVIGLALLTNGTNLLIFTTGGWCGASRHSLGKANRHWQWGPPTRCRRPSF